MGTDASERVVVSLEELTNLLGYGAVLSMSGAADY